MIRRLAEDDLEGLSQLIDGFVANHPARDQARPRSALRDACVGPTAVFRVLVAESDQRLQGFVAWTPTFDLFWSERGGEVGWLYVRPEDRGHTTAVRLVASACAAIRHEGGRFLRAHYGPELAPLYETIADGLAQREGNVAGARFDGLADRADANWRELARFTAACRQNDA